VTIDEIGNGELIVEYTEDIGVNAPDGPNSRFYCVDENRGSCLKNKGLARLWTISDLEITLNTQ